MTDRSDVHHRIAGAVVAMRESGLEVAATAMGPSGTAAAQAVGVTGGTVRAITAVLAPLGFAEIGPERGPGHPFVAYDAEADRWLRLEVSVAPGGGRRVATGTGTVARAWRRIRGAAHRRSLRVALLGPDGAGKSSLAAELARSLPIPVRRFYGGLYPVGRRQFRLRGLGTAATILRLWRTSARATVAGWLGRLVVFDRYPLDALVLLPEGAGRLHRWRAALLARSCPRPDLVIVLDAPVAVLHERRREQAVDVLEAQRRRYADLARTTPGAVVVAATADIDGVRRRVTEAIWKAHAERRGAVP